MKREISWGSWKIKMGAASFSFNAQKLCGLKLRTIEMMIFMYFSLHIKHNFIEEGLFLSSFYWFLVWFKFTLHLVTNNVTWYVWICENTLKISISGGEN